MYIGIIEQLKALWWEMLQGPSLWPSHQVIEQNVHAAYLRCMLGMHAWGTNQLWHVVVHVVPARSHVHRLWGKHQMQLKIDGTDIFEIEPERYSVKKILSSLFMSWHLQSEGYIVSWQMLALTGEDSEGVQLGKVQSHLCWLQPWAWLVSKEWHPAIQELLCRTCQLAELS